MMAVFYNGKFSPDTASEGETGKIGPGNVADKAYLSWKL